MSAVELSPDEAHLVSAFGFDVPPSQEERSRISWLRFSAACARANEAFADFGPAWVSAREAVNRFVAAAGTRGRR
jgi:hypothetical protein